MDDRGLDRRLRHVPTPAGLVPRVSAGAFDDASLDRGLRGVAVPVGLAHRIAVAPPPHRVGRATPAKRPSRRRASRALATVVRDLIAVAAALAGIWLVAAGGAGLSRTLSAPSRPAVASRPAPAPRARVAAARPSDVGSRSVNPVTSGGSATAVSDADSPPSAAPVEAVADAAIAAAAPPPQVRGATVGLQPEPVSWTRPAVRTPRDAWRRVPRSAGYDLLFELTHGEPPFIDPRADDLRADIPPLTVQTESFDRFTASAARGRQLRTEHVLAAIPPPHIAPPSTSAAVVVAMHAVRSLRGVAGHPTQIVEVAATAGDFVDRSEHRGVNATIVLDRAAGGDPLAWRWACRAVVAVAERMRTADRVTLVVAGPVPRVAIRAARGDQLARVAADLAGLTPSEDSDLDAALAVAQTASGRDTPLIVVGQETLSETRGRETKSALGRWQERTAGGPDASPVEGVPEFVLIDAGTEFEPSQPAVSFGRTAADPVAIRRTLLARVFGRDTLVAARARLTVDFDPATVAAYRLVGHRQSAVESLSDSPPETVDLHVGETARAVYEVVPRSAAPITAAARFQWASADGPGDARAVLHTGPDATATTPSPHGCELLLAMALGERESSSAHAVPRGRAVASDLIGRWRARGDVTPLGEVLADAVLAVRRRETTGRNP